MLYEDLLSVGFREDLVDFDFTAQALPPGRIAEATIVSKAAGVFFGAGFFRALSRLEPIEVLSSVSDGQALQNGTEVARIKGPVQRLLRAERSLLNLIAYASGIATQTASLRNEIEKIAQKKNLKKVPLLTPTRKTLPHYKDLALLAVQAGGGALHRINLANGILLKENHLIHFSSIREAIAMVRDRAPHLLKVEIEVEGIEQFKEAMVSNADVIMLDDFSESDLIAALDLRKKSSWTGLLEISGGISAANLEKKCQDGVDILSVGALTHSVKAFDFSMRMRETT